MLCCSVTKSCPALRPHELQHTMLSCPSLSPRVCKFRSIKLVMLSSHFILCCPLLFSPSIFPSIWVFSNESALHIGWPNYWSFSFSSSPCSEYLGLMSFRIVWFDFFAVQGALKSLCQHHSLKASILQGSAFIYGPTLLFSGSVVGQLNY